MNRFQYFFLAALAVVCIQLGFATPYLNLGLIKTPAWLQIPIALAACTVFTIGSIWIARFCEERSVIPLHFTLRLNGREWVCLTIIAGCFIRILWDAAFPTEPISDGATYVYLGEKISRGEPYSTGGTYAFWPPGYPFLLSLVFKVAGYSRTVMLVLNLVFYAATIVAVYLLAKQVLNDTSARFATALLALWPNHFMATNIEMKEYVLLPILVGAIWLYLTATRSPRWSGIGRMIGAGAALGFSTLVQPSCILFVTAIIFYALTRKELRSRLVGDLFVLAIGLTLVLTPWVVRNYSVFGTFVLTTAGGDVLYRANNPLATGGYTHRGEVSLDGLDEVAANKKGRELAFKWIAENPMDFLKLAFIKQVRFLGDDSSGANGTLKSGAVTPAPVWGYASVKALSNLYWLLVWACVLVGLLLMLRNPGDKKPELALIALCFLYFYGMHSIFESNGKYHFQTIGFIAILASAFVYRQGEDRAADAHTSAG